MPTPAEEEHAENVAKARAPDIFDNLLSEKDREKDLAEKEHIIEHEKEMADELAGAGEAEKPRAKRARKKSENSRKIPAKSPAQIRREAKDDADSDDAGRGKDADDDSGEDGEADWDGDDSISNDDEPKKKKSARDDGKGEDSDDDEGADEDEDSDDADEDESEEDDSDGEDADDEENDDEDSEKKKPAQKKQRNPRKARGKNPVEAALEEQGEEHDEEKDEEDEELDSLDVIDDLDLEEDEADDTHDVASAKKLSREQYEKMRERLADMPSKDEIRAQIMGRAQYGSVMDDGTGGEALKLTFLEDPEKPNVFIGRKKGHFKKYGYQGALYIGKVSEDEQENKSVYLDSLNPHVIFVCGARGSGKSYVLGVVAEEIARSNPNVGTIVIDPVGVFWSMRYPNKEERELKSMADWNLTPEGLKNLKVFIPEGMREQTPKNTYDALFSVPPSLLTSEDWALTFGIERFSPSGLLLEIAIKKVQQGYKKVDDTIVKPKKDVYSLDDIIDCLESDSVLHSKDRGYKPDSIRALVSRFEAAKSWGIFTAKGTPLSELSCEGQLTVIDTSFLEDNVTALVIGILARRVLSARKMSTRKEAAGKFKSKDVDQMLEFDIPPTWLFIDEAHTLIPSGNVKTPATAAIVEYVKQGRRPGCSMVFATQQPSAIDTKVLSQLDIMIAHKLVFDDDIKAVYRRVPTIVPAKYKRSTFIKTLPIGTALIADRSEETSRAFIMKIRPRMSQHEGRDAETTDRNINLKPDEVKRLMIELIMGKLNKERSMPKDDIGHLVETLNTKYKSDVSHDAVITGLVAKGAKEDKDNLYAPDYKPEEAQKEIPPAKKEELKKLDQIAGELIPLKKIKDSDFIDEDKESMVPEPHITVDSYDQTELYAIPVRVNDAKVQQLVNAVRKKRALGMFGSEERIEGIDLKYSTIWKVTYDSFNPRGEFVRASAYIDGDTGELLHFANGAFVQSRGLEPLSELGDDAGKLLRLLTKGKFTPDEIIEKTKLTETRLRSAFEQLYDAGFMDRKIEEGKASYWLKKNVDLPPTETHPILQSIEKLPVVKLPSVSKQREKFGKEEAITSLKKLWPNIVITTVSEVFRPFYYARLSSADGKVRTVKIDAFTGTISG